MVSMTKQEMIQYLKDYANIQNMMAFNPSVDIETIFTSYMIKSGRIDSITREYYDRMRRVYMNYNYFKSFSIVEDFLLNRDDYLSNNDLDGLENGCKLYTDMTGITNKRIVQLIRNAFNHNDNPNFDRFKMSVNGKNFEIEFQDIRTQKEIENNIKPKPVRIKFNLEYLYKLTNTINAKRQNLLFMGFDIPNDFDINSDNLNEELDKITFVHYYFTKKLSKETVQKFRELGNLSSLSIEELTIRREEIHAFAQTINMPMQFNLTQEQKDKVIYMIDRYRKDYPTLLNDVYNVIYYFLMKVIPVPGLKTFDINNQLIYCSGYLVDVNISLNDIIKRICRVINEEEIPVSYDEINQELHKGLSEKRKTFQMDLFRDLIDGDMVQGYPIITYLDAVITHCCYDEEVTIGNITYNKEKIRNSFAHGRWFISKDKELIMFDADPRNINDYNLEFVGKIDIDEFENWADMYMENYNNKIKRY